MAATWTNATDKGQAMKESVGSSPFQRVGPRPSCLTARWSWWDSKGQRPLAALLGSAEFSCYGTCKRRCPVATGQRRLFARIGLMMAGLCAVFRPSCMYTLQAKQNQLPINFLIWLLKHAIFFECCDLLFQLGWCNKQNLLTSRFQFAFPIFWRTDETSSLLR